MRGPEVVASAAEPATATERVYDAIYAGILERRLAPGTRLREVELAAGFEVSRTVVRQALQRLAQDHLVELQHNRGAQVGVPTPERAAQVFDARRVLECEVARRLGGRLGQADLRALRQLVQDESEAHARGDAAAAIRLSGQFHRSLVALAGNPEFLRWMDELLPTTSLLMAMNAPAGGPACVAHGHGDLLAAFERSGPAAAAEMKRHLAEIERTLAPRDAFRHYRARPAEA